MTTRLVNLAVVFTCSLAALLSSAATALATNDYFRLSYTIREDPSDPGSDVIFKVIMEMSAVDQDGNWIGWQVDTLYFVEPSQSGGDDEVWKTDIYDIDSADGLWWVEHEKPNDPSIKEFDMPPEISGEAPPLNSQYMGGLIFIYWGENIEHALGEAKMGYTFTKTGEAEPEAEDEERITEIDRDPELPLLMAGERRADQRANASDIGELAGVLPFSTTNSPAIVNDVSASQPKANKISAVQASGDKNAHAVSDCPALRQSPRDSLRQARSVLHVTKCRTS